MNPSEIPNGFFPDDVILQILARLPVKSLFRFKSVCKFWCRLPGEKFFIQLYNEISSKNSMVLVEIRKCSLSGVSNFVCVDRSSCYSEFSLGFLNDRVKVRASCNGLLCCTSVPNRSIYYVCNPMTRECRMLPRSRERPVSRYHPDNEATLVGLAADQSARKFNVVLAGFYRPFGRRPLDCLICQVFDSETNAWKRFASSCHDEFTHMNRNQAVFACGSIHWLTYACLYVLVLDLGNEVWRKIRLPDEIANGPSTRVYLLELEGKVSVIQISGVWMSIWVLVDYEREEWAIVDRVSLRCIKASIRSAFPISQTRDFVFLATQNQILVYGRKNKVWKVVYSVMGTVAYPLWFSAYAFRSTLLSCHGSLENP
ncbi:F-box protein At5g49610 [Magnolia sinica]|uniref:F-box protein At5g49610 n=1 Tax=Magnolia sinica TaxID=86752 RepID=UPI00265ADDE1|nr:F-box protein At5g49610 [Magnolia sinica]